MAEERNAAGGRTPGPSGRGGGQGGTSPAAASRIRVDISDVTKLRQAIKDTQSEAKKLSDTLAKFDTAALPGLRKVVDEVKSMQSALATSGTRAAIGPKSPGAGGGSSVGGSNMHAGSFSGKATLGVGTSGGSFLPQVNLLPQGLTQQRQGGMLQRFGSYLTTPTGMAPGAKPTWANVPIARGLAATLGGVTSVADMAAGHLDDATTRSYLVNTMQLMGGGSTGFGAQMNLNRRLGTMMGPNLGYADVSSAAGRLMTTGITGGAYGASRMSSTGFLSQINPLQGAATSATQVAQTFTSQNYYAMRLAGINASTARGQNMQGMFDQIIDRIERGTGRPLTPQEIQSGAAQGSHLNADLTAMGLQPDVIQNLLQYWAARRASGGRRGVAAINAAGARNNLGANYAQRVGTAKGNALSRIDVGFIPGASGAARVVADEYKALGAAADNPIGRQLAAAAGGLAVFKGQLDFASRALKGLVEWMLAERVLGVASRGPVGRMAGRLGGAAATRIGGALGGVGLGTAATATGVVAAGAVDAYLIDKDVHAFSGWMSARHEAQQSQHRGKYYDISLQLTRQAHGQGRSTDATFKLMRNSITDAANRGDWKGADAAVSSLKSWLAGTGASGQDAGIWGGSGTTFPALEAMAKKGPHEIVTSTTGGTHAKNSYHYKGQAVDLADKRGSVDSPGLLAINHYLAKNYGHKLAELIYAGPGGINIKNGKVVNGMATYGAQTMGIHHNHVHVAATPASLGMKGGVDVGAGGNPAGGGPQNAASSGGFAPPGMGGGLDNIFQDSSSAALFAALSGASGGSTGPVGSPRTTGLAGGASGASGGLGGPPGKMPTGNLAQWERQALSILRLPYGRYARGLTNLIMHESGGNPHSQNNWDSNAKAGHPSKGLMQTIDSTFKAHALPGHGDIWNPVDNIIAGVRYAEGRYGLGMIAAGGRHDAKGNYIGYARGIAEVLRDEMAMLHKGEMVVQAPEAQQLRALIANSNASTHATARTRGGRVVPVNLVFQMHGGGEAEARKHAAQFARFVAEDHEIEMVASG